MPQMLRGDSGEQNKHRPNIYSNWQLRRLTMQLRTDSSDLTNLLLAHAAAKKITTVLLLVLLLSDCLDTARRQKYDMLYMEMDGASHSQYTLIFMDGFIRHSIGKWLVPRSRYCFSRFMRNFTPQTSTLQHPVVLQMRMWSGTAAPRACVCVCLWASKCVRAHTCVCA